MKLKFFGGWAVTALVMFGAAFKAYGQANPGDCLQYPIYDDGMGSCLWDEDHYDDQSATGCMSPQEYYVWADSGLAAPETCGGCMPRGPLIPPSTLAPIANQQLPVALDSDTSLKTKGQPSHMTPGSATWNPQLGTSVLLTQFAQIESETGTKIPVKLYALKLDQAAGGVTVMPKPPRFRFVGFEVTDVPASTPVVHFRDVQSWANTKHSTRFACRIQSPDGESDSVFTVFTFQPIFISAHP